jgi:hypothetical protein
MNNIKVDIRKVVSENLKRTRKEIFQESFSIVRGSSTKDEFLTRVLIASSNLISEGYEMDEIESFLNEQDASSLVAAGDDALSQVKNADWGKLAKGTIMSSIKEYAIKWLLNNLGMKGEIVDSVAIVFAEYDPLDLLKPFKDMSSCMGPKAMPKLCDAIMEAVGRYIGGQATGGGGSTIVKLGVGNLFGEAIEQSNLGEIAGAKFCNLIHG